MVNDESVLAPLVVAAALALPRHAVFGAAVAEKPAGLTVVRVLPGSGMDHLLYRAASPKAALDAFAGGAAREYDTHLSAAVIAWLKQQT